MLLLISPVLFRTRKVEITGLQEGQCAPHPCRRRRLPTEMLSQTMTASQTTPGAAGGAHRHQVRDINIYNMTALLNPDLDPHSITDPDPDPRGQNSLQNRKYRISMS
jgi:hypothetical protein